jgi:hypothetical protein
MELYMPPVQLNTRLKRYQYSRRLRRRCFLLLMINLTLLLGIIGYYLGKALVINETPQRSDAIIILSGDGERFNSISKEHTGTQV